MPKPPKLEAIEEMIELVRRTQKERDEVMAPLRRIQERQEEILGPLRKWQEEAEEALRPFESAMMVPPSEMSEQVTEELRRTMDRHNALLRDLLGPSDKKMAELRELMESMDRETERLRTAFGAQHAIHQQMMAVVRETQDSNPLRDYFRELEALKRKKDE